jgi:hypothetical protein
MAEKLYSVHVIATCTLSLAIQVEATSEKEARKLALEAARDRIDNNDIDHDDISTLEATKVRIEDIREGR